MLTVIPTRTLVDRPFTVIIYSLSEGNMDLLEKLALLVMNSPRDEHFTPKGIKKIVYLT